MLVCKQAPQTACIASPPCRPGPEVKWRRRKARAKRMELEHNMLLPDFQLALTHELQHSDIHFLVGQLAQLTADLVHPLVEALFMAQHLLAAPFAARFLRPQLTAAVVRLECRVHWLTTKFI